MAMYGYRAPPIEESIYNLIPPEQIVQPKPPRHVSKYPHDAPTTASTFGASNIAQIMTTNLAGDYEEQPRNHRYVKAGANFGPKNEHYSDPTSYLTKQNKPPLPNAKRFTYKDIAPGTKKEGPPALADTLPRIKSADRPQKNYIQQNALAAITQTPGNIPQEPARFTEKKTYGKVPAYMKKVKKEIVAEKAYIAQAMDQERQQYEAGEPKMRLLPEAERLRLLDNLKKKWEAVNLSYQGMTHCVVLDTIGKRARKENYENQMKQLEQSIEKMSKPHVFVQDY